MEDELISVADLASQLGKRKQSLFKIVRRLGIETKRSANSSSRGQLVAYVTNRDARRIQLELAAADASPEEGADDVYLPTQQGVFYLLQLEPAHDAGRFKVGFATNLSERLRSLRCSAPFAKVFKSWKCKFLWEKTAIDCVTDGCERLHTEVFRATSMDRVVDKCEQFFKLMPKLV